MGRILRITAIFLTALIGGVASFLVFVFVQVILEQDYLTHSGEDAAMLSICVMMATLAILAIIFQSKFLTLSGNNDEHSGADIIDHQAETDQHTDFGFLRKLHWSLWSANFAFSVGIICLSLYLLNNYLTFLPFTELPHGWERYTIVLIALMLGIMLVTDTLVLLKNYISTR